MSELTPDPMSLASMPEGYLAAVVGARGAIGGAVAARLAQDPRCARVLRYARATEAAERDGASIDLSGVDVTDAASLAGAAAHAMAAARDAAAPLGLVFIATGALSVAGRPPEKALSQLDPAALAAAFQLNAIGPALAVAAFQRALPRRGKSVIAALSARVGSIGDNRLGGWYGYRASKAALNQMLRTAAIEIARSRPEAVVAALHPGTVESGLSRPFRPAGAASPDIFTPEESAARLLRVLDGLGPEQSGGFFAYDGTAIPW